MILQPMKKKIIFELLRAMKTEMTKKFPVKKRMAKFWTDFFLTLFHSSHVATREHFEFNKIAARSVQFIHWIKHNLADCLLENEIQRFV